MTKKKKIKIWTVIIFGLILVGLGFFLLSGGNLELLKSVFRDDLNAEEAQDTLSKFGWRGYITFGILSMLQVVFTFLPAEPAQVVSGIAFGFWKGSLICLAGVVAGNTIIYILYHILGDKLSEYFHTKAEFDFDRARKSNRVAIIIFILYFLPAIPYGLICLFAASLDIKYPKYIFLTALGSIPSICIGVGLGHMAMSLSWILSVVVFVILVTLLIILVKKRTAVFAKINQFMRNKKEKINRTSLTVLTISSFICRLIYGRKIKATLKNNVGKLDRPAIVLCNHGSFIDFIYAGRLIKKERPHFVSARLYFYHKTVKRVLKWAGALPKSMFTSDVSNAKNCMRVLAQGRVLAMMPEARLSTAGMFEGIQESTYKFIKRANVAVYAIKINGDYLANPKWGTGARKGSKIEAEINELISAKEITSLSYEQVKERVYNALYYDEFDWLETRPDITYKCPTLAEGLENILYICPKCGARYSIKTDKMTVCCEKCQSKWSIDNRYAFTDGVPFKNFKEWYIWQVNKTEQEILSSEDYKLQANVELRHSSKKGKSFTEFAGNGVCILTKDGLTYKGTEYGNEIEKFFPMKQIYRLLFGAGEDFEIYEGKEIWYFRPEELRSCVEWYVVSGILKDQSGEE